MTEVYERTITKSRKQHQCSWCAEPINIGESYRSYLFRDGRDSGYVKMHPECYSVMQDIVSREGHDIFWMDGDFARGCGCQSGNCKCDGKVRVPE